MNFIPHFSPSIEVDGLVFISGQVPFDTQGNIVQGGIRVQTARCLKNMEAILATRNLSLAHVVKTTVWLARVKDFAEFNEEYALAFPGTPPARSTVRADLMVDALVEIEAVARRPRE
jgi:2-iminobutanoate/2-iminopropanoate deaminase